MSDKYEFMTSLLLSNYVRCFDIRLLNQLAYLSFAASYILKINAFLFLATIFSALSLGLTIFSYNKAKSDMASTDKIKFRRSCLYHGMYAVFVLVITLVAIYFIILRQVLFPME